MHFADPKPTRWPALRLLISAAVMAALLVACGDESAAPTGTADASAAQDATNEADVVAVTGPLFETVDGGQFDMGSIEGTDTVLWFWAPW